jgi:NAD(P)-dependent dehydrogenase (short-subunit alcohol dehydrogenase family)
VKAAAFQADLTVPANVTRLFADATAAIGTIDVAVNTVGKVLRKPIAETTEDEYDSMFAINSKAAYFFIQEAGKQLADGGKIITIVTSLLAAFTDGYSTYAGGKSPVEHFTRAAAKEFAGRGISVTAIGPGRWTPVLLRPGDPGACGVPQVAGDGRSAHRHRGHRPDRAFPRHRRLVDHRPDHLRQRRLHDPLSAITSPG